MVLGGWGSQFQDSRHMKVVRLPALCIGRFYPQGNIPGTTFLLEAEPTPGSQRGGKDYVSDHQKSNPRPTNIDKPIKNGLFLESWITYNDSLSHWLPIYDTYVRYSYITECFICKLVASLGVVSQQ